MVFAIHAYETDYCGLHGIEDWAFDEGETENDEHLHDYGRQLSMEVIESYGFLEEEYTGGEELDEDEFNTAQLGFATLYKVYDLIAIDENGEYVLDENGEKIVVNNEVEIENISGLVDFGDATPANTFNVENTTFRYDVPLSYFGDALLDEDGNAITAEAYIGKRGDVTLDNIITASDATYMLTAYTKINSVTGTIDANTILFTRDVMTKDPASVLNGWAGTRFFIPVASLILCGLLVSEIPMFSMKFKKNIKAGTPIHKQRIGFAGVIVVICVLTLLLGLNWSFIVLMTFVAYIIMNIGIALLFRKK